MIKILYISCHQTLEHDEVSLLRNLGFDVFTIGYYTHSIAIDPTRNSIVGKNDEELYKKFIYYFNNNFIPSMPLELNQDFVDNFDVIICSHYIEHFDLNWKYFTNKMVVWRTIALTTPENELKHIQYRQQGSKIIRLSPIEREMPNYTGEDATIRTSVDSNYFNNWNGMNKNILTVQKRIKKEIYPRLYNEYNQITSNFTNEIILCGKDNEDINYAKNNVSEKELLEYRQNSRVYLALTTRPAGVTYTFVEAMITGMPVVSIGKNIAGYNWFEQADFIKNGENGFCSDNITELQSYIKLLLNDYDLAKKISINARESMMKLFSLDAAEKGWKTFFIDMGIDIWN